MRNVRWELIEGEKWPDVFPAGRVWQVLTFAKLESKVGTKQVGGLWVSCSQTSLEMRPNMIINLSVPWLVGRLAACLPRDTIQSMF